MSGDYIRQMTALGEEEDRELRSAFCPIARAIPYLLSRFDPDILAEVQTNDALDIVPGPHKGVASAMILRGLEKCESPIEKAILPWLVAQRYQFFDYSPTVLFAGETKKYVRGTLAVIPQLPIGRYRVDFALAGSIGKGPVRFVVVECDGKEFHDGVENVKRDINRDVAILANDRVLDVIRIDGSQIMHNPERAAQVAAKGVITAWSVTNKNNAHKFGPRKG